MKNDFSRGCRGLLICLAILLSMGLFTGCNNKDNSAKEASEVIAPAETSAEPELKGEDKLVVIWSSRDRDVAINMAMMYTLNSARFKWWKDITFVVWGPSAKLLSEDEVLQGYIADMLAQGITVKACQACADSYGVSDQLRKMGIDVKLMSELTNYMKDGRNILTF